MPPSLSDDKLPRPCRAPEALHDDFRLHVHTINDREQHIGSLFHEAHHLNSSVRPGSKEGSALTLSTAKGKAPTPDQVEDGSSTPRITAPSPAGKSLHRKRSRNHNSTGLMDTGYFDTDDQVDDTAHRWLALDAAE